MKKIPFARILVAIILTIPSIIGFVRFFSGEDNRICSDGNRIKHGNPRGKKPNYICTGDKQKLGKQNSVLVSNTEQMESTNFSISMERPNNGMITKQYTCQGEGKFPEIHLTRIPSKAKSIGLIVDDPDAPGGTRDHLLLANIEISGSDKIINNSSLNSSTIGKNSRGKTSRGAPCPPTGTHRYFFKVFALDTKLNLKNGFTKQELIKSMENHIIEKRELIGLYKKE